MEFWKAQATRMLRAIDPDLKRLPIYLVTRQECCLDPGYQCWAWTSSTLDLRLERFLRSHGEWRGRGFAAVFDVGRIRAEVSSDPSGIEELTLHFAIHETGHFFQAGRAAQLSEPDPAIVSAIAALERHPTRPRDVNPVSGAAPSDPLWTNHGGDFIRPALHLARRAQAVGYPVDVDRCSIAGSTYGLSDAGDYADALGDELESEQPLFDILENAAPEPFRELFAADTRCSELP